MFNFKNNKENETNIWGTDAIQEFDEAELELIYGGCSVEFSPLEAISSNIIIDEPNK